MASEYRKYLLAVVLAYLPITLFDEVKLTWVNTVKGNCTLSSICEYISPLNGLLMKKMMSSATPSDNTTPTAE